MARDSKPWRQALTAEQLKALPWAEGQAAVHAALLALAKDWEKSAAEQADWVWLAALHVEEMGASQWAMIRDVAIHGL